MNTRMKIRLKKTLSKVLPDSVKTLYLAHLPRMESWRKSHPEAYPLFTERTALYDHIQTQIVGGAAIDYLEFGVYKGESLAHWTRLNAHEQSRFYGFDTFSGLPDHWECFTDTIDQGTFDTKGATPELRDQRVAFVKGLFQDTVSPFLAGFEPRSRIVVHNDSDLYTSTLYVLTRCHDLLVEGTILIFDEFSSVLNEFRALEDYVSSYRRRYEVIGAVVSPEDYYTQVAIVMR
jgi:O-methyltransferase